MSPHNFPVRYFPHPGLVRAQNLSQTAVVVIDVLRATTTITAALDAGSQGVVPCASVAAARALAAAWRCQGRDVLLAGERGGLKPVGFDLGNSPQEFLRRVRGRVIVLATSNGTRALAAVRGTASVRIACFNNLSAAAAALVREPRVALVASGEHNRGCEEDTLAAGLLLRALLRFRRQPPFPHAAGAGPVLALDPWARFAYAYAHGVLRHDLLARLRATPHGKELIRYGFTPDVAFCAQLDSSSSVPRLQADGSLQNR
jgi:2-phosphosulfolactate phosphatase